MATLSPAVPPGLPVESSHTAVSWGPILAGALAGAGASVLLLALGAGLGLSSVSPWSGQGVSATALGVGAAVWLIVMHWVSAGIGGYITGRLRVRWTNVHSDEVLFRDTAHGFITWAVGTVLAAALVAYGAGALAGGAARTAGSVVSGVAQGAVQGAASNTSANPSAYFADMLFRPGPTAGGASTPATNAATPRDTRAEAVRILGQGAIAGEIPAGDRTYLAQAIQAETGLPQAEAEARVNAVLNQVKAAADQVKKTADDARKAAASLSFFTAFAMLVGAFVAAVAAALGGRERDDMEVASRPR